MTKMKIKWTTKDVDTDKVINEWTVEYSRSELLEVMDKCELLAIKDNRKIVWHSRFPNGKAYWVHTGQPIN